LTDDQFWFSFFHEAAHLILHRERRLFLEGIPEEHLQEENEANEFAASILVPPVARAEMMSLPKDLKVILKFAKQIGVSAGIVLGQLQHAGRIPHGHFSRLKTRYKWTA
jgi:Zn-dependent peptidase ImmA (M78 family)